MGSSEQKLLLMWQSCQDVDSPASWCLLTAEQGSSNIQHWADQAPGARSLVISSTCSRMNTLPFCSKPLQALSHMSEWGGGSQQQPERERKHYRTAHSEKTCVQRFQPLLHPTGHSNSLAGSEGRNVCFGLKGIPQEIMWLKMFLPDVNLRCYSGISDYKL